MMWIILGIIYAICIIPAWFMTRVICSMHRLTRPGFLFLTIWLIMPLFPIYFIITYIENFIITYIEKKHEQRD